MGSNLTALDEPVLEPARPVDLVASYMASALDGAPTSFEPWKYVFVENIFPAEFYERLNRGYGEAASLFSEQVHTGDPDLFYGSYRERLEFKADYSDRHQAIPNVFRELQEILISRTFFVALKRKLGEDLVERFGDYLGHPEFQSHLDPTLLITKHSENYYLGAHTDRKEKVVTCIFNLAESSDLDHIGTALYVPCKATSFRTAWCITTLINLSSILPSHFARIRPSFSHARIALFMASNA